MNADLVYQPGEEGALQTRFGGVANAEIDPELRNSYMDEASVFLERVLAGDVGLRAGYVWRKDYDGCSRSTCCARSRRSTCRSR